MPTIRTYRKMPAGAAAVLVIVALATVVRGAEAEPPSQYILDYPAAERFCPPIDGFFREVQLTIENVGSRTIRHQPNGGYGLPIKKQINGVYPIHVGADVGWLRVGEPVFAVADGVVRMSQGPTKVEGRDKPKRPPGGMAWGNLIAVEQRLADDSYVTTIYGHLDTERLVSVGDVVTAGQQIGTIGAKRVNGGYIPHLHFGVRKGRLAEKGRHLFTLQVNDQQIALSIGEVTEECVELRGAEQLPENVQVSINGRPLRIQHRDGRAYIDATYLWHFRSREFPIIGYDVSTESWFDPVAFLREQRADTAPAAFQVPKSRRSRR